MSRRLRRRRSPPRLDEALDVTGKFVADDPPRKQDLPHLVDTIRKIRASGENIRNQLYPPVNAEGMNLPNDSALTDFRISPSA